MVYAGCNPNLRCRDGGGVKYGRGGAKQCPPSVGSGRGVNKADQFRVERSDEVGETDEEGGLWSSWSTPVQESGKTGKHPTSPPSGF